MTTYSALLIQGAAKVRAYKNSPSAKSFRAEWFDRLADDMEKAGALTDQQALEHAIHALAHRIVDSGPLEEGFAPAFGKAIDALQRSRKRRHA